MADEYDFVELEDETYMIVRREIPRPETTPRPWVEVGRMVSRQDVIDVTEAFNVRSANRELGTWG